MPSLLLLQDTAWLAASAGVTVAIKVSLLPLIRVSSFLFSLTATEIVNSGKEYTDDELRKLLSGHLCRCTGYQNIFRAVKKTMLRRLGKTEEADAVR